MSDFCHWCVTGEEILNGLRQCLGGNGAGVCCYLRCCVRSCFLFDCD